MAAPNQQVGIYDRLKSALGAPAALDSFEVELRRLDLVKSRTARALSDDERRTQDMRADALTAAVLWHTRAGVIGALLTDVYVLAAKFQSYVKTGQVPK